MPKRQPSRDYIITSVAENPFYDGSMRYYNDVDPQMLAEQTYYPNVSIEDNPTYMSVRPDGAMPIDRMAQPGVFPREEADPMLPYQFPAGMHPYHEGEPSKLLARHYARVKDEVSMVSPASRDVYEAAEVQRNAMSQVEGGSSLFASNGMQYGLPEAYRDHGIAPLTAEEETTARRPSAYPVEGDEAMQVEANARLQVMQEVVQPAHRAIGFAPTGWTDEQHYRQPKEAAFSGYQHALPGPGPLYENWVPKHALVQQQIGEISTREGATFGHYLQAQNIHPDQIGDQRDAHGCLSGAGYEWCPHLGRCARPWEEQCQS